MRNSSGGSVAGGFCDISCFKSYVKLCGIVYSYSWEGDWEPDRPGWPSGPMWRLQHLRHQEGDGHRCTSRTTWALYRPHYRYHTSLYTTSSLLLKSDLAIQIHYIQANTSCFLFYTYTVYSAGHGWTHGDLVWLSGCGYTRRCIMKFQQLSFSLIT